MDANVNATRPKSSGAPEVEEGGPLAAVLTAVAVLACCLGLPILLGVLSGGGIALFAADGWGFGGAAAAGLIIAFGAGFAVYKLRRQRGASGGRASEWPRLSSEEEPG